VDFVTVQNGAVELNVAVSGSGPLIVCVHGFPELLVFLRTRSRLRGTGFSGAALDVRATAKLEAGEKSRHTRWRSPRPRTSLP